VSDTPLRIVRVLSASPEEVFDAWTDPASMALWMCPGTVERAMVEADPRVGGRFRIVMKGRDCDHDHAGEYLVVDRPRRLVFTWTSEATQGRTTTVSVVLRSRGPDETELVLTHDGLPDDEAVDRHRSGWGDILQKLSGDLGERRDRR
jgi:uncharacterized protein YndB with AHSA1/START domain